MCLYFFHLLWPSTISKRQATRTSTDEENKKDTKSEKIEEGQSQEAPSTLSIDRQRQQKQLDGAGVDNFRLHWLRRFWSNLTATRHNKTGQLDGQDILLPLLANGNGDNSNYNNFNLNLHLNSDDNSSGTRGQRYASNILDSFRAPLAGCKIQSGPSENIDELIMSSSQEQQQQLLEQQQQIANASANQGTTTTATTIASSASSRLAGANEAGGGGGDESVFRIKTAHRRHLDFDGEYDLGDTLAPARSKWSGPFHFIQAADCQFGMIDSYVHKRTEPGWREEIELCEKLVGLCNRMAPKPLFIIICGDLIDSLPASQIGQKQVADFKRIFAKLDERIPLVCVCGNHDVGDEPTIETVSQYRQTFGDDYFYFTKKDILFIVINSQFYQHREFVCDEARKQDEWLERVLSKCKLFKYSILFEHIPWFLETPDEENDYFNIRKEVRMGWLRKFKDAGVTKIMCGHYHRNAGGWFEGMELVVTTAIGAQCGTDQSGIRIVKVFEDTIEHKYYPMQDVPLNIELKREQQQQPDQPSDS